MMTSIVIGGRQRIALRLDALRRRPPTNLPQPTDQDASSTLVFSLVFPLLSIASATSTPKAQFHCQAGPPIAPTTSMRRSAQCICSCCLGRYSSCGAPIADPATMVRPFALGPLQHAFPALCHRQGILSSSTSDTSTTPLYHHPCRLPPSGWGILLPRRQFR